MSKFSIIPVMYRDADNYKSNGSYHVEGEFTPEQKERLRATLHGDDQFLPGQIGGDHLGEREFGDFDDESDHPWHELDTSEIYVSDYPEGDSFGTPEDFVAIFEKAAADGWDDDTYGTASDDWTYDGNPYALDLGATPPEAIVTEQPRDIHGRFGSK